MNYNYALSLTSQFYFCSFPLRLDTYNLCTFNCPYCYMKNRGGNYKPSTLQIINIEKFKKTLWKGINLQPQNVVEEFIQQRIPIHFGGVSDPFSEYENKYMKSFEVLKNLNQYQYPTIISTRSGTWSTKEYINIIKDGKYIVQLSMPTNNSTVLKRLNKNKNIYHNQLKTIDSLIKNKIPVVCRLQPFIPRFEEEYINIIEDLIKAGVKTISIEYLKLPLENEKMNFSLMDEIFGFPLLAFYKKKEATRSGREWVLPSKYKYEMIKTIKNQFNDIEINYADNDLMHLNKYNCCIGKYQQLEGFQNTFNYNITTAIKNNQNGVIKRNSIEEEWYPKKSINRIINSKSRISGEGIIIKDYIDKAWNSASNLSPINYHGVLKGDNVDDNQNIEYKLEI